jgi:hypothetical protein
MAGVPTSFIASVCSGTRHSIAHTISHVATLTVEVPSNPDDFLPLFLAPIPSNIHSRPRVVHIHADSTKQKPTLRWVALSEYWILISANATEPPMVSLHLGFCDFWRALPNEPLSVNMLLVGPSSHWLMGSLFSLERDEGVMFGLRELDIYGGRVPYPDTVDAVVGLRRRNRQHITIITGAGISADQLPTFRSGNNRAL